MANEYVSQAHVAITIKVPHGVPCLKQREEALDLDEALFGPHSIVLYVPRKDRTEDRVWFLADYHFVGLYEALRPITEDGHGYSMEGDCLFSVPASWCKFHDEESAEEIIRAMDADQRLLGYARG